MGDVREYAGYRRHSVARSTGTTVVLLDGIDAELDTSGGRWQTVCDPHGTVCSHDTHDLARSFMSVPEQWCETCQLLYDMDASVHVTEEELARLIEASDPEHHVLVGWGTGSLRPGEVNRWARVQLAMMRGLVPE